MGVRAYAAWSKVSRPPEVNEYVHYFDGHMVWRRAQIIKVDAFEEMFVEPLEGWDPPDKKAEWLAPGFMVTLVFEGGTCVITRFIEEMRTRLLT